MSAPYDYKALIDGIEDDAPCRCEDCEWVGVFTDLAPIEDCCLTPGDPSPAGRCPECDTLAYVVQVERRELADALDALNDCNWLDESPTGTPELAAAQAKARNVLAAYKETHHDSTN